ncbi:hypothetical protein RSO41_05990 [Halomonas sp. I1]|uniref:hypothetical protein n=1 Tax=Halomonas sp. I1 TaxID=393536 RepID=UPI0028DF9F0A|nr:hypothetical protein [Halomonas sp. I1]MDT8894200.1 hypothetical protein [Halomonas sp. I1]
MVTNDPRQAWALARDDGLRSQSEVTREQQELGVMVDTSVRGGQGAAVGVEYGRVLHCIEALPIPAKAVGDALNARGVLNARALEQAQSLGALSAAQMVGRRMPGYPRWKPEKQRMLYYVALAAMERAWVELHAIPEALDSKGNPEGRALDRPWKVQKHIRARLGQPIEAKNWGQNWGDVWKMLLDAIYEQDAAGQDVIERCVADMREWQKAS